MADKKENRINEELDLDALSEVTGGGVGEVPPRFCPKCGKKMSPVGNDISRFICTYCHPNG